MTRRPTHALVLTGAPGTGTLDEAAIAAAGTAVSPNAVAARWLGAGEAWEASLALPPADDGKALRERAAGAVAPRPVDVNVVPAGPRRRKRLLVADMESTVIEQECLDELAAYAGLRERVAGITARAMRGELGFEAALTERVALLKGLDAATLDAIYARVTVMPGAETLIATMRRDGAHCALVSGGFTYFTERIAARLGFDSQQANTLELANGKLAGTVREPILGREAKLAALQRLAGELSLDPGETLATGDGANDLGMIRAAGLGVAFRAKPVVAEAAAARIDHGDLTALLYLQGYTREEFATRDLDISSVPHGPALP